MLRIEINGRAPDSNHLTAALLNQYGNFTGMQVRDRRVRGLDVHLNRLAAATAEMFGVELDGDLVQRHLRHALTEEHADSDVRVQILRPGLIDAPVGAEAEAEAGVEADTAAGPTVVVIVRPPFDQPHTAQRLRSVRYQRPLAHIKQVGGSFGQIYHGRAAEGDGYADALLTADDGTISETTIANIGFFDGSAITWPDAPTLDGVTKQLLQRHGPSAGLVSKAGPVTLDDVPGYRTVFVTNSLGIAPVSAIDGVSLAIDEDFMATLYRVYESMPWDAIGA